MGNGQETVQPPAESVKELVAADELVVGLAELPLVTAALATLGVWPAGKEPTAQDEQLGLALLTGLSNLDGVAAQVRADLGGSVAALEAAGRPVAPIDLLLLELRRSFRASFAGYVPPLGKSRTGFLVVGSPYPKGMQAATIPLPVGPPEPPYASPVAGAGVRVGILDTPLSAHPDLAGRYVTSRPDDVLRPPADGGLHSFRAGHGTFVADLIRRQAPAVQLEAYGLLGSETGRATLWDTALAILRLGNAGVDVLNLSLACLTEDDEPPLLLRRALDRIDPEVVVVAAAGNHGNGSAPVWPAWPAALDGVIAVGAAGAPFSASGPWVTCTAPGEDLTAAYLSGHVRVVDPIQLADLTAPPPPAGPAAEVGNDTAQADLSPSVGAETTREFTGHARWSGTSFAAAWTTGAIAARTVPGRVPAREALRQLLDDPGSPVRRVDVQPS